MSGFPQPSQIASFVPNLPQDFGYLGWTADPILDSTTVVLPKNNVLLVRFRAMASGSAGHVVYTVSTGGSGLTSSENFVGLYDTGQALAGGFISP